MTPLYEDPWFTFRFVDERIIPRFQQEGVEAGRRVEVFKIDAGTGERLGLLAGDDMTDTRKGGTSIRVIVHAQDGGKGGHLQFLDAGSRGSLMISGTRRERPYGVA